MLYGPEGAIQEEDYKISSGNEPVQRNQFSSRIITVLAFRSADCGSGSKGDADYIFEVRETHRRNCQIAEYFREQFPIYWCHCPFPIFGLRFFPLVLGESEPKRKLMLPDFQVLVMKNQ